MRKLKMARRGIVLGAVLGVFMMLSGDPRAQSGASANWGIDPLEVLQVQVKNNVLFVFDTSGSMRWPVDYDDASLGGDAVDSRLYKGKQAVASVVRANRSRMNFGLASYNVLTDQKVLNNGEDNDGNGKREVFVYISADTAAAAPFYVNAYCPSTTDTRDGFFCSGDNAFANWDGTTSSEVWRSFNNRQGTRTLGIHNVYTDPVTGVNHHYLHSSLFRGNTRFTWNLAATTEATRLVSQSTIACPNPPAGLVGWTTDTEAPDNDGDGVGDGNGISDQAVPCIEMVDNAAPTAVARFYYTSAIFNSISGPSACGGASVLTNVAFCTGDNSNAVLDHMRAELPIVDALNLQGVGPAVPASTAATVNYIGINPTPSAGVRADQSTPIMGSLARVRTGAVVFPVKPAAVQRIQKNFVVFITDGDDTCASAGDPNGNGTSNDLDDRAIASGQEASRLYYQGCAMGDFTCVMNGLSSDNQHQAETFFIAFASAVNIARSDGIAQGGSGAVWNSSSRTFQCPAAVGGVQPPCRNAFQASTTDQLIVALEQAMQAATASGEFSATQGTLGTVFELADLGPTAAALDRYPLLATNPLKRYDVAVNLFFQSTFKFPGWEGHLYAYKNDGTFGASPRGLNVTERWDAGETLFEQIAEGDLGLSANTTHTFDQLKTRLRRRIFTSAGNGTWTRATKDDFNQRSKQNVISLWPPDATTLASGVDTTGFFGGTIDPPVPAGGPIDAALGIDLLTFPELQAQIKACEATSAGVAPPACDTATGDTSLNPALALATAKKEARQITLAYTAGAQVALSGAKVMRSATSPFPLLYKARGNTSAIPPSILADTQLSQPAVVTPPLRSMPSVHTGEFLLFRDGPRGVTRSGSSQSAAQADFDTGFGLRNPDSDTSDDPSTAGAASARFNAVLKPRMTVVYIGAADGLHAFSGETSEELWMFTPWDQLSKLRLLASTGQTHSPHIYAVSSSVRVADIFIPTPAYTMASTANAISYNGVWRTVAFFGRGPGGKYLTALDITSPAQFTISRSGTQLDGFAARQVLNTNPPWVMWNRGNPDIKVDGSPVRSADTTRYGTMAETWSVPAVGNVPDTAGTPEWRAYVGSGYGSNSGEGNTFYELDAITGNVLRSWGVGNGNTAVIPRNALVASPAGYNSFQLDPPNATTRGADVLTRLYIPDVHGRIWKFSMTSGAPFADGSNGIGPVEHEQPFGDAVALLKVDNKAYVYANSGHERRVRPAPAVAPPFKMFAYRDDAPDELNFALKGVKLFEEPFPIPAGSTGFRAAGQPATAFNSAGNGRAFFLGTLLNTANANCLSSFDSILFAVGAQTGQAIYDFDGSTGAEKSILFLGERMMGPGLGGKQMILTNSGSINAAGTQQPPRQTPMSRPVPRPDAKTLATVHAMSQSPSSTICRF